MDSGVIEVLKIAGAVLTAAGTLVGTLVVAVKHWRDAERVRRKYKQALKDLQALWYSENTLCEWLGDKTGKSGIAVKRRVRDHHRRLKIETPSSDATPQRIQEELAKL